MRKTTSTPWLAAALISSTLACAGPERETEPSSDAEASGPTEFTVADVVASTVGAVTSRPRAYSLVETAAGERREGTLWVASPSASDRRFLLTWSADPPSRVASDGVTVTAVSADGRLLSSDWSRAGSVLMHQEAGKLAPTAIDPSSFGEYGGTVLPEEDGLVRLQVPLPNGGGWELAVSAEDRLPRRVSFRAGADDESMTLELSPIEETVPAEAAAYRLALAGSETEEFFAGPRPGDSVPDLTFELVDGTTVRLADLRGSAVVLDFWATWCVPCRPAMAELEELYREFAGEGLEVFGLRAFDSGDATAYLESVGVTYPIGSAETLIEPLAVGAYGLPLLYAFDRDGRVVDLLVGYNAELTPPKLRQVVLEALGHRDPAAAMPGS